MRRNAVVHSLKIKTVLAAVGVGVMGLGTGTAALAATRSANPNFSATLSESRSHLFTGQTATVTKAVINNTSCQQSVTLSRSVLTPKGQTYVEPSQTISLSPGQTLSQTESDLIAPRTHEAHIRSPSLPLAWHLQVRRLRPLPR